MKSNALKICVAIVIGLFGATAHGKVTGLSMVGKRDSSGSPTGVCRIVDNTGHTLAKGAFKNGKLEGPWVFYDLHVKVGEMSYAGNYRSGPYRTFLGSEFKPPYAGEIQSQGWVKIYEMHKGQAIVIPEGRFVGYSSGKKVRVMVDVIFHATKVVKVTVGSDKMAKDVFVGDMQFFDALEQMVREGIK